VYWDAFRNLFFEPGRLFAGRVWVFLGHQRPQLTLERGHAGRFGFDGVFLQVGGLGFHRLLWLRRVDEVDYRLPVAGLQLGKYSVRGLLSLSFPYPKGKGRRKRCYSVMALKPVNPEALRPRLRTAYAFGTDLLYDGCRGEIGQQNRGNKHRTNDGFGTIQGKVARDAKEGEKDGKEAFKRDLEQFYDAHNCGPYPQGNQFDADRDAPVAQERVT
jgi:hypothetical protein